MKRIVGGVIAGILLSFGAPASADLIGDKDCWTLAASCPDGSLWRDGLGGVFFTDYRNAGEVANAPFTDIWSTPGSVTYTHTGSAGDSLEIRIAGIGDINAPYNVLGDGVVLGQIPLNNNPNAFQEVQTFTFAVPALQLADNMLVVSIANTGGDGFAIDYSELGVTTAVVEPGTLALFGLGLAGLGFARRRKTA